VASLGKAGKTSVQAEETHSAQSFVNTPELHFVP
jgi:hypothetical protein